MCVFIIVSDKAFVLLVFPPLEYHAMIADSREINWFLDVWSRDFFYKHVVTSYTYQDTW